MELTNQAGSSATRTSWTAGVPNSISPRGYSTTRSERGGFRKETIAGMRRKGRDAPIMDLPAKALRLAELLLLAGRQAALRPRCCKSGVFHRPGLLCGIGLGPGEQQHECDFRQYLFPSRLIRINRQRCVIAVGGTRDERGTAGALLTLQRAWDGDPGLYWCCLPARVLRNDYEGLARQLSLQPLVICPATTGPATGCREPGEGNVSQWC